MLLYFEKKKKNTNDDVEKSRKYEIILNCL